MGDSVYGITVCCVFVFHSPLTPVPSKNFPTVFSYSICPLVCVAKGSQPALFEAQIVSRLVGNFSKREAGRRYGSECKQNRERRA